MSRSRVTTAFIFYSEVNLTEGLFMTELTWVLEPVGGSTRAGHHYFVNYPGARDLERQTADVVGGKPLTRYSAGTVIKALTNDLPPRSIMIFETLAKREKFKSYMEEHRVEAKAPMTVLEDALLLEEDREELEDFVRQIRAEAASRFGSSL